MHMEYRMLPHGGERISVIGLGTSSLGEADEQEIIETVRMALDHGINYIDMASGHAATFSGVGKAIAERRDQVYLQIHFGADYTSGEYGWTTDPKKIKAAVAWQLDKLQTDHIDFGFIHCIDEESDLRTVQENGIIDAILDGSIDKAPTKTLPVFDFKIPTALPGVDPKILDPRDTYKNAKEWDEKAADLAGRFIKNFEKFTGNAEGKKLVAAGPHLK